jgi:hypothetical protein
MQILMAGLLSTARTALLQPALETAAAAANGLRSFRLASMFVWRIVQQLQQAALGNDSSQKSDATAATTGRAFA